MGPNLKIPFVGTGSASIPANLGPLRDYKFYVNGEIEVARSLGDFCLKHQRIREGTWQYPSAEREKEGVEGFKGDVISCEPWVRCDRSVFLKVGSVR